MKATTRFGRRARRAGRYLRLVAASVLMGSLSLATVGVLSVADPKASAATPPPTWEQLSPATSPPGGGKNMMAYDSGTGQLVLFGGGVNSNVELNDTWTWNGTTWTQLSPATSPPGRNEASMAYDSGTGQLVLFGGGVNSNVELNDTWTWNGTTWTQLSPATSPPARHEASMAYDGGTGQLVLFGGIDINGRPLNDTWTWNGTTWTQLSPAASPPALSSASMAYDSGTGQLVLCHDGITWTWNGSTWTQLSPATSPSARIEASMTYDPDIGQLVLFGGLDNISNPPVELNDTWTWNGTTWTQQFPVTSPSARDSAGMAYYPGAGQLVLFGAGFSLLANDTWVYLPVTPIPTVAAVSPSTGPVTGGTAITITGTGFVPGATVVIGQGNGTVGAIAATNVTVVSWTKITAVTGGGAKAGTWDVFVTTSGGTSAANSGDNFSYNLPVPTVSGVNPNNGPTSGGTAITITGTGFLPGATVVIGQGNGTTGAIAANNVVVVSSTEITAVTGGGAKAGTWNLFVTTSGGTNPQTNAPNAPNDFSYAPVPKVSGVDPNVGSVNGGTAITITGTGFVTGATVVIGQGNGAGAGAIAATNVTVVSWTKITAVTGGGAKAGTWTLFVTTSGGTSGPCCYFTYNPVATVSAVSPNSGPVTGGTPITITGTGFVTGATVVIGQGFGSGPKAIAATNVVVVSWTKITAVTGGGAFAGTWNLFVSTSGGTSVANAGDYFTYH